MWDSGKVESEQSIQVAYAGKLLQSSQQCFWKVKVWTMANTAFGTQSAESATQTPEHTLSRSSASEWSKPAFWSMGLLDPASWTAKWIARPLPISEKLSHPWLRRTFELSTVPKRAVLHMNTPSWYELYINGQKVMPYVLTPGISQHNKRILINSWDVTSFLKQGTNCIAIWMGPGVYQPRTGNSHNGPILRAQLNIDLPNGDRQVIGTDSGWRFKESCISQIGTFTWGNFGGGTF